MKFWEAMRALEEGNSVKPSTWEGHIKWHLENWNGTKIIKTTNGSPGIDFSVYLYQHLSDEWEIYEEPQKTYSFIEIIKGLKEGKKFRRRFWNEESLLGSEETQEILGYRRLTNQKGRITTLFIEDFEATDWIEVK